MILIDYSHLRQGSASRRSWSVHAVVLAIGCCLFLWSRTADAQPESFTLDPAALRTTELAEPVKLKAQYSLHRGLALATDELGIGTYMRQVAAIKATLPSRPREPVPPDDGIKRSLDRTIYGKDDRRDFFQIPDPTAKQQALAVASISTISERDIHARGICTAFLVSKNRILTASHCVNFQDFRVKAVRFNDQWKADGLPDTLDSYEIDGIDVWDRSHDFALVRIKPRADGTVPGDRYPVLKLDRQRVPMNTHLYMVGHPAGEYKKFGANCTKLVESYLHPDGKYSFGCDCDAFGGNSGSPIFRADTHNVAGILWGGQKHAQTIPKANQLRHEFVVPIWRLAVTTKFDHGTWPRDLAFVAATPFTRNQFALFRGLN